METEQLNNNHVNGHVKKGANGVGPNFLGWNFLNSMEVPPKVQEMLLWKNPKFTAMVFGSSFVTLISFASFSFLSVFGFFMFSSLTLVGLYRFYLALYYRIFGCYDDSWINKLATTDFTLPKERVQELAHWFETDINKLINQAKSIILWDNIFTSGFAFIFFYFLYCVGSVFNTLTLLTLLLVSAFTVPKVYLMYKKPIDQTMDNSTAFMQTWFKQLMTKLPPAVKAFIYKNKKPQ